MLIDNETGGVLPKSLLWIHSLEDGVSEGQSAGLGFVCRAVDSACGCLLSYRRHTENSQISIRWGATYAVHLEGRQPKEPTDERRLGRAVVVFSFLIRHSSRLRQSGDAGTGTATFCFGSKSTHTGRNDNGKYD